MQECCTHLPFVHQEILFLLNELLEQIVWRGCVNMEDVFPFIHTKKKKLHRLQLDGILHWNCFWKKKKWCCIWISRRAQYLYRHVTTQLHFAHKITFTYLKEKRIENNLSDKWHSQSNTVCFPLSFKLCSFSKLHYRIDWKLTFIRLNIFCNTCNSAL